MSRIALSPDTVATPEPPYSQVVLAAGTLVAVSGQGPLDRAGRKVGADDVSEQARQVFRNIGHCPEAAGCGLADLIRLRRTSSTWTTSRHTTTATVSSSRTPTPRGPTVRADLIGTRIEVDALSVRSQAG